jgi:hypothetical protein
MRQDLLFGPPVAQRAARREVRLEAGAGQRPLPLIVANPAADVTFRGRIDRYVTSGSVRPAELQAALRSHYPRAVVRRRELTDEELEVWYVYREGRWITGDR